MKPIKLAVFDMEGTIFRNSYRGNSFPSLWAVLCNLCGPDAAKEDAINRDKFYAKDYPGYSQWVIDTLKIHQNYGLKRDQFEALIEAIDYYPGVAETFAALRKQGITIAVISGGLKALADRVALDYEIEHCFAAAEYFWNPDGSIRHWNVMPTDFAHKKSVLEILCRDLGITGEECIFVGDGRNDRDVAGYCTLSIGFNPHSELRDDVDIIIEQPIGEEDLSVVLQPIAKFPHFSLDDFSGYKVWNIRDLKVGNPEPAGTLSTSGRRDAFHAFLVRNDLTRKSADSYCSYLNNLCRNIAVAAWNGADTSNAFTLLECITRESHNENAFVETIAQPISGPYGRENDIASAAKQFHRFINS
ncbi:MAG: HAD family hydrolase [Geobacteraceae bacterium]